MPPSPWHASQVKFVYPQGDGSFVVEFVNNSASCSSAAIPTQYFYVVTGQNGVNADGLKNLLATALTAYATGSVLSIAFDNATPYCYINRFAVAQQ
jgi:hypothetical protein